MLKVIKTAAEVKAILAETTLNVEFWQSKGINPDTHFHDLTPEEIKTISQVRVDNTVFAVVRFNAETIPALLGLREAGADEASLFSIGKTRYCTDNNKVNRFLSEERSNGMTQLMLGGYFATGPGMTISSAPQFINGAHRGSGAVKAVAKNPTLEFDVVVEFGVPPQLRDLWDFKNREKKVNDLLFQNPSFMADDVLDYSVDETGNLVPLPDELDAQQRVEVRNKLSKEYVSYSSFALMRISGSHIHSKVKDEQNILKFHNRVVDGECDKQSERLCYEVHRRSLTIEGKVSDQFKRTSPAMWASALLLLSNADNDDSGQLEVNWGLVDNVLTALKSSTEESGPFALMLRKIGESFSGKKSLSRKAVFDVIVKSIKQYMESGVVTENPVPTEKQMKEKSYPTFGGVDIGYQAKVKDTE